MPSVGLSYIKTMLLVRMSTFFSSHTWQFTQLSAIPRMNTYKVICSSCYGKFFFLFFFYSTPLLAPCGYFRELHWLLESAYCYRLQRQILSIFIHFINRDFFCHSLICVTVLYSPNSRTLNIPIKG